MVRGLLSVLLVLGFGGSAAFAQSSRRPPRDPFGNLFKPTLSFPGAAQQPSPPFPRKAPPVDPQALLQRLGQLALLQNPQPTVVCGMTVVPVDQTIDPKMVKPVPEGHFTMRVEVPPICAVTPRPRVVESPHR